MDFIVTIQGSTSTVSLSSDGPAVTLQTYGPQVTLSPQISQPAVNPDGTRQVTLYAGPPVPGPAGANAEVVILTLAEYLALDPEVQMDGRWYVIPKP